MNPNFLIDRTGAIVAAYISRNRLPSEDIPILINSIHAALHSIGRSQNTLEISDVRPNGKEISSSVGYDQIKSFLDGKPYKSLKRHLTAHGLTPDRYRARYGLPTDYPMVAPGYAAVRARIAKQLYLDPRPV